MTGRRPGRLIALEGIDGCGKSTQARILAEALGAVLTHEPGATALGQALRGLLLDPSRPAPIPRAEALLMAADRAQHVEEVVRPALAEGRWVVTDRFSGSTLAYQGWGRGLATDPLRQMVAWAAGGLEPDLSVLVDVGPEVARQRLGVAVPFAPPGHPLSRPVMAGSSGGGDPHPTPAVAPDRLERLDGDFHERVRHGFVALARADGEHWAVVDGSGEVEAVAEEIATVVGERLGRPGSAGPSRGAGRSRGNAAGPAGGAGGAGRSRGNADGRPA